jgi:Tfp pilus assembly protein PilX
MKLICLIVITLLAMVMAQRPDAERKLRSAYLIESLAEGGNDASMLEHERVLTHMSMSKGSKSKASKGSRSKGSKGSKSKGSKGSKHSKSWRSLVL